MNIKVLIQLFLLCRWQQELGRHEQQHERMGHKQLEHEHREHKQQQLERGSMLNKPKELHSICYNEHHLPSFLDDPKLHPNVHHNGYPSCYSVKRRLMELRSMMVKRLVRLDQSIRLKHKRWRVRKQLRTLSEGKIDN